MADGRARKAPASEGRRWRPRKARAFGLFAGSALGTAVLGRLLAESGYDAVLLVSGLALLALALLAPRLTAAPTPAT